MGLSYREVPPRYSDIEDISVLISGVVLAANGPQNDTKVYREAVQAIRAVAEREEYDIWKELKDLLDSRYPLRIYQKGDKP
jgi:hypothetical protein